VRILAVDDERAVASELYEPARQDRAGLLEERAALIIQVLAEIF
jgi:hypothetical protein